jgi:succinylglutamate desuccinylase
MTTPWDAIAQDFLKYTLDNHHLSDLKNSNFPSNTELKHPNFKAKFLGNGLLFLIPNNSKSEQLLILSVGVHGNETAPMELLQSWVKDLFSGDLLLNIPLMIIIGNPAAAVESKRFLNENLNRLFSTKLLAKSYQAENSEQYRSIEIMQHLKRICQQQSYQNIVHFDLHTAIRPSKHQKFLALPYLEGENSQQLLQFWSDCGLTAALRSSGPAGTFSYFSQSQLNAISATVELGKVHLFGENDLAGLSAVDSGIRGFISQGKWPKSTHQKMLKLYQVKTELIKTSENFKLNIEPNFANFTEFKTGYLLAEDPSKNYQYKIDADNDVLVFPNTNLPVGQRAGLVAECIN